MLFFFTTVRQAEEAFRAGYSVVATALLRMGLPPARLLSLDEHPWRLPDVISNFAHELESEIGRHQLHSTHQQQPGTRSEATGCVCVPRRGYVRQAVVPDNFGARWGSVH